MTFITQAFADTPAAATSTQNSFISFLPMIIIFILFWFLLIRPQQKKAKEHTKMITELKIGDTVLTNGGIFGKINQIKEQIILLEIADNIIIQIQKNTIANKIDPSILIK